MHYQTLERWRHSHDFTVIHHRGEQWTLPVLVMIAEILAGSASGSMALRVDGWHMDHTGAVTPTP